MVSQRTRILVCQIGWLPDEGLGTFTTTGLREPVARTIFIAQRFHATDEHTKLSRQTHTEGLFVQIRPRGFSGLNNSGGRLEGTGFDPFEQRRAFRTTIDVIQTFTLITARMFVGLRTALGVMLRLMGMGAIDDMRGDITVNETGDETDHNDTS